MDKMVKIFELSTKTFGATRQNRYVYLGVYPDKVSFGNRNCALFEELLTLASGMLFSAVIKFGIRVQNGKMKLETCRKGMRNYILF